MRAKRWMWNHVEEHVDMTCFEVCATTLAEETAQDLYGRAAEEREFELADEVAADAERYGVQKLCVERNWKG